MTVSSPENPGTGPAQGQPGTETTPEGTEQGQETAEEAQEVSFDDLPETTKAEIRKLRRENAGLRTQLKGSKGPEAKQTGPDPDMLAKVAKALGLDDGQTAQAVPQDNSAAQEALVLAKTVPVVYRLATKTGSNPDAVLDSRSFLSSVAGLDPSDADFETNVEIAVREAVAANSALKATTALPKASRSGGDLGGGKGATPRTYSSPQERLAAAYAASNST